MCAKQNVFQVYQDMKDRTDGELYIGVVGPVRTGKSTFIKKFMETEILPKIKDEKLLEKTRDELPQSGNGTTIMTTEPKFIPSSPIDVEEVSGMHVKVKLIDCVGFVVDGASGALEEGKERLIKTPWYDYEIPFKKAAHIGTEKVIKEHASVGIVVTTDGSIGTLSREAYQNAEEEVITQLKELHKPFVILLNSIAPLSPQAQQVAHALEEKYGHSVVTADCQNLGKEDVQNLFTHLLAEFPATSLQVFFDEWLDILPTQHPIKMDILEKVRKMMEQMDSIYHLKECLKEMNDSILAVTSDHDPKENQYIKKIQLKDASLSDGTLKLFMDVDKQYYYQELSSLSHEQIENDFDIIQILKQYAKSKSGYDLFSEAFSQAKENGYSIVEPQQKEMELLEPVVEKAGSQYAVRIHAHGNAMHFIQTKVEAQLTPFIGTKQQAEDLIAFIERNKDNENGIWTTNIFGKTVEQMVEDSIHSQIDSLSIESRKKLQEALQKISSDPGKKLFFILL